MDILRAQNSPLMKPARIAYRSARGVYRMGCTLKNRSLNFFDNPIIVLIYHRVIALPTDPEMIAVSPVHFRQQMEYLKQNFRILRFEEDWSRIKEPAVVVTFDDGYADNVLEALPILDEVGVPASFFVSTGHIGTGKQFWWHQLQDVLLRNGVFPDQFELKDSRYGRVWSTVSLPKRAALYAALSLLFRKLSPYRQEDWLDQLRAWVPPSPEETGIQRHMSAIELQRLAASPWATIGAHTVTHAALSLLSEEEQRYEIFSSKQQLEMITGKTVETFSYPFGRKCEYNRTSVRLCREAGFLRVAANFPGQAHKWTDPMQIPRHLVRNWDLETFAAEMQGVWTR